MSDNRVRLLDRWDVPNRSDHDALVASFELAGLRQPGWHDFCFGTWNWGNRGTFGDLWDLFSEEGCDAVAVQEASDRNDACERAEDKGLVVLDGSGKVGQAATRLIYNPRALALEGVIEFLLLDDQYIGPGAGPDRNKDKWLIGGRFTHRASGRKLILCSMHVVPSQYNHQRLLAALEMNERAEDRLDHVRPVAMIGADFNARWRDKSMEPFRQGGWKSVQAKGGPMGTHGQRPIDDIIFLDGAA